MVDVQLAAWVAISEQAMGVWGFFGVDWGLG